METIRRTHFNDAYFYDGLEEILLRSDDESNEPIDDDDERLYHDDDRVSFTREQLVEYQQIAKLLRFVKVKKDWNFISAHRSSETFRVGADVQRFSRWHCYKTIICRIAVLSSRSKIHQRSMWCWISSIWAIKIWKSPIHLQIAVKLILDWFSWMLCSFFEMLVRTTHLLTKCFVSVGSSRLSIVWWQIKWASKRVAQSWWKFSSFGVLNEWFVALEASVKW